MDGWMDRRTIVYVDGFAGWVGADEQGSVHHLSPVGLFEVWLFDPIAVPRSILHTRPIRASTPLACMSAKVHKDKKA